MTDPADSEERTATWEESGRDDKDNNLLAAGAILALLQGMKGALTAVKVVTDAEGDLTNQIDIGLSFMRSPYRITVERVADGEEEALDDAKPT